MDLAQQLVCSLFDLPNNIVVNLKDIGVKALTDSIFDSDSVSVPWVKYARFLDGTFSFAHQPISKFFGNVFMPLVYTKRPAVPRLDQPSSLLNSELLSMVYVANIWVQQVNKMNLITSGVLNHESIQDIMYALKYYKAPTLLLLKHTFDRESFIRSNSFKRYAIVGCLCTNTWKSQQTSNESFSCVFELLPKFKILQSRPQYADRAHLTINDSDYNHGIGIGTEGNYRLFISGEKGQTKLARSDPVFGDDALLDGISELNVNFLGFSTLIRETG